MANASTPKIYTGTLTASIVDNITLTSATPTVTVVNQGLATIWIRVDGADPVIGAAENYPCPAGAGIEIDIPKAIGSPTIVVKLISSSNPLYTVFGNA